MLSSPRRTHSLILIALFATLTAIGAFIRIPIPFIPFTLQFFFCALAGFLLGSRLGSLSQVLYVVLGLLGLPIFTAGGGPGYILQPSFGYLPGFIAAAWIIGKLRETSKNFSMISLYGITIAGLGAIYLVGVSWLYGILRFYLGKPSSLKWALGYGLLAPLAGDLVLSLLIAFTARKMLVLQKERRNERKDFS